MPRQNVMVVAGMSAPAAASSVGLASSNLTATGTSSQANALPLPADVNKFTTVALNAGCLIQAMNAGDNIVVLNFGANPLLLYPPVGGFINALGQNAAYSIAIATPYCQITCVDPTHYHCFQSA